MAEVWDYELSNHFSKASSEFSRFVASVLNKGSISYQDREAIHERAKEEGISIKAIDVFLEAQLKELFKNIEIAKKREAEEKEKLIKEEKANGRVWEGELQTQFANASIEFSRFVASVLNKGSISDQEREVIHEMATKEGIGVLSIDAFLDFRLKDVLRYAEQKKREEEQKEKEQESEATKEEAKIVDRFSWKLNNDSDRISYVDIHSIKRAENLNHLLNIITEKLASIKYDFMTEESLKLKDVLLQKYAECINLIKTNCPNDERFASLHSQEDIDNYVEKQKKMGKTI